MHYIGLMSGTSVDGVDSVVVSIPSDRKISLVASHTEAIPPDVVVRIQSLMQPGSDGLDAYGALDMELGELFSKAAIAVTQKAGLSPSEIRAIGSHGQTVRHRPNGPHPFTTQIGNPSVIAERTGVTTVADFRARDIAAGGQGAPLVPAFHQEMFRSAGRARVIANIGGIANVTCLPKSGATTGFDTGPGNTLIDQWAQRHIGTRYDKNGQWAASGKVVTELLQQLLNDNYFAASPPKSTGREYFNLAWIDAALTQLGKPQTPQDGQATLVELTANNLADAMARFSPQVEEMYLCGGGCHNTALVRRVEHYTSTTNVKLNTTEALVIHPDWVEACAFAWLAHRALEGQTGNVPDVTGAKRAVVLGGIYPVNAMHKKGG
jgi:anhydro-N-acetylmuramic acid kinase